MSPYCVSVQISSDHLCELRNVRMTLSIIPTFRMFFLFMSHIPGHRLFSPAGLVGVHTSGHRLLGLNGFRFFRLRCNVFGHCFDVRIREPFDLLFHESFVGVVGSLSPDFAQFTDQLFGRVFADVRGFSHGVFVAVDPVTGLALLGKHGAVGSQ